MADDLLQGEAISTGTANAEEKTHGSTIFVSNLPYAATSTDLQTLFSDLAPIRSAFVVQEGNVSKGVGYVSFALTEDASKAMETIGTDGIALNGRNLRVQWADKKPKEKGEGKKEHAKPSQKPAPKQTVSAPKDPNAIRTIVISGLPKLIDHKTLWKKVRKCDGAESVVISEGDNGVGEIAHAVFSTPRAASQAVEKLHAHVFKGSLLSVTLKKRVEGLTKVKSGVKTAVSAPTRGSRLIVRNLPWNISEKDLRALFLPFGPIYSVHIPLANTEDGKKHKARGFAFVWFFSKKDAERAIEGVNGKSVVAGAVSAPTMNKKERARLRRKLRENQGKSGEEGEDDAENSDDEGDAPNGQPQAQNPNERIVAVDWALSKDKWEEAKAQGVEDDEEAEEGSEGSDFEEDAENDDSSESGSDVSGSENGESDEPDLMDVDEERSHDEEPIKPSLPAPEEGTTVFVRNVSFDSTEDDLRTLFRSFGPLRYARITMDHDSGRSRGTGFVCFWKKEDADTAVHQSELLNREAGAQEKSTKNPFSLPSILTPDPSSSLAQSLVLHGRTLHVTHAVTRKEAEKLKDEGERSREKADKRNLYLLREGVIFPNSPAASTLSPSELEKRLASFDARKGQLKSNPSLFVSKTRLAIRQIPLITTERSLKRLANHAIRTFEQEVKNGTRQPLTEDELREDVVEDVADPGDEGASKKSKISGKQKRGERETKVRQSKIVRQSDRVDAVTGKGRSKGYGFLELHKHADALRVLRWANNNPDVQKLLEEWWQVELKELAESLEKALKDPKGKKVEVEGESKEDTGTRLQRVREELARHESGELKTAKRTLHMEFSIENAQVVRRRSEHQKDKVDVHSTSKKRSKEPQEAERPTKKRRVEREARNADNAPKRTVKKSPKEREKAGQAIGSLIGRKRKARKAGKGS